MTTIAYNHKDKEIAFDIRTTRGEMIVNDNAMKAITNSKGVFVMAGSTADCALIADIYPETPDKQVDCYGFVVVDNKVFWVSFDDNGVNILNIAYNEAAGSGQDHAVTAMDLGCSAGKAVQMAIKRDVSTGGKVRVIKIK
jgi:ATP-dependent protease HslVU (ClpYQ) peptidase subunit